MLISDYPHTLDHISDRLVQLRMTHWLPVLHVWLRQYRGLEQNIACLEDWPENLVLECLDTFLAREVFPSDSDLSGALARLDFLTWRARHEDGIRWQPLEESYESFCDQQKTTIWQWDTEIPEPCVTEAFFSDQLRQICKASAAR